MINNPSLGKTLLDLQGFSNSVDPGAYFSIKMIPILITVGLIIGSLTAFFKLLLGAIQWIASGGDKAGLESAQKQISNALIGLLVLFGIFAIFKVLELIFGVSLLSINLASIFIK